MSDGKLVGQASERVGKCGQVCLWKTVDSEHVGRLAKSPPPAFQQVDAKSEQSLLIALETARPIEVNGDRHMAQDAYGIREGEIAVDLPASFDAGLYFIGRIRTPWTHRDDCPKNARESDAVCTIELDVRYAAALRGVDSCSHLLVLYWMDKARRDLVVQAPRHYNEPRGTFALRSPVRPNPVAASVVRLLKVEGAELSVVGLDCLNGTPLVDIKPYFASVDAQPEATVGWHAGEKQ
jgi:tRNA-Thr(GGU) m(6)t(6)A37 methyltransferase TsaA